MRTRGNTMRNKKDVTFLKREHADIIKNICKGCIYYNSKSNVRDMCSIISWYVDVLSGELAFDEFVGHIKGCPCNQKCLVKASCREEQCPIWIEYSTKIAEKRMRDINAYRKRKLKNRNTSM